jgi:23S rRNA (cytidine2498-2'-O)-methyltransferase
MDKINKIQTSFWIGTANAKYGSIAIHELKQLFPSFKLQWFEPGDLFMFTVAEECKSAIERIRMNEPIFLRHIQPVHIQFKSMFADEMPLGWLDEFLQIQESCNLFQKRVAVQVRKSNHTVAMPYNSLELKQAIDANLTERYEAKPCVQQMDYIISVFLYEQAVYVGGSRPEDNLSSWSGGAIHYRKSATDISRAKFKLMEAELRFSLDFNQFRSALDLGAAPGGWSSFLLERGVQVTAVDPANMHPSLLEHREFQHMRMTASAVPVQPAKYDLIVCDMSWDPFQMANTLKPLLSTLFPGGTVITTIKLMHGKALSTQHSVQQIFAPKLNLQKAKQLFHNREELTSLWLKVDE